MSKTIQEATVDVVVPFSPAHTPKKYLSRALEAIEGQTVATNTIIVTDDEQRGPSWARNTGIGRANERFVAFCDADDYWEPSKIEQQLEGLLETGASLSITQTIKKDSGETNVSPFDTVTEFVDDVMLRQSNSFTSSMLIDTSKVQPQFNEELTHREDHLFALQAAVKGACFVPEPLTIIQKHSEGLSQREGNPEKRLSDAEIFFQNAIDAFPHLEKYESEYWHRVYHTCGRTHYFQGNYDRSIELLRKSLTHKFHYETVAGFILSYVYRLVSR
jgi:glycosyltransferase involved in cell wall biosynthesis